jgi:hypothetical protein
LESAAAPIGTRISDVMKVALQGIDVALKKYFIMV